MLDLARYRLATLAARWPSSRQRDICESGEREEHGFDRYERQRSQRLAQLEAAGKCLARPGKHDNLKYWPADRGSRVLLEHRRRQRLLQTASRLA